jgi:tetratricopeptide (TPR) repeat protein
MALSCSAGCVANSLQAEVLVRRGLSRHGLGDYAAALADYEAALAVRPGFPEAHNNRGVAHHALGDYTAALAAFGEALRARPDYSEALNNRGVTRHALGAWREALADFNAALRLSPLYAAAYNNRAATRRALKDLAGALADCDTALRLNPRYAEAWDNRATVNYLLWRHGQAVADLNRALALYGDTAAPEVLCRLFVSRGDALYHTGNAAGLLADYRRSAKIDIDRTAKLIVSRIARDIEASCRLLLANCDKHLRACPDDAVVYARRGLVYLLLGQDADARRDIDEYYRRNPGNPLVLFNRLIEEATRYREQHGAVVPGDTFGFCPPQLG